METKIDFKKTKSFRLVIKWGDKKIDFGNIEFKTDGSLIFISKFHSDKSIHPTVEFGRSIFKDNQFSSHIPEKNLAVEDGFHISLHPKKQKMHFRRHYPGEILYERNIDWFPVRKPFNLLHFYTLPLDLCKESPKKETFLTAVDPNYKDSIFLKVDLFPRDTKEHVPYEKSIHVMGVSPNYLVRISLMFAKQRTPAMLYWSEDSVLEL
jgi:hypothetical protein